jgi:hypothetical protein
MVKGRHAFIAVALGCLLPVSPPCASPDDPSAVAESPVDLTRVLGAARFDYFSSSKTLDDERGLFGATLWAKYKPVLGNSLEGFFEGRVSNFDIGDSDETESMLIEGYITAHLGSSDVRVGKQIVAWGRADAVNPTENLTPRDYTLLLPFDSDQRVGTTAVRVDYFTGNAGTLVLFWTPFFEPSNVPLVAADGTPIPEDRPERTFENSEFAAKWDNTGGAADWSVSYFRGFSLLPLLAIAAQPPVGTQLRATYPRLTSVGADFSRNVDRYGFRAEVAYIRPEDEPAIDADLEAKPSLFAVVGVDRTFAETLNVNVQLVFRNVYDYVDPISIPDPARREVAITNAVLFGTRDAQSYGFTTRIADRWFYETLQAELFLYVITPGTNYYARPSVSYAFTDRLVGHLGGEYYRGPADTYFGALRKNSGVFVELRASF